MPQKKPTGTLRIIGGQWRSRKLPIADLPGLRPTMDRVRETVFNWIAFNLPQATVLDLFSGTGALAFESLSRGAKSAVMLEKSPVAAQMLKENLQLLKTPDGQVLNQDTLSYLNKPALKPFDIIFIDPPFHQDLIEPVCDLLETNGYLTSGSLIYIEAEKMLAINPPSNWQLQKQKEAGQLSYALWRRD